MVLVFAAIVGMFGVFGVICWFRVVSKTTIRAAFARLVKEDLLREYIADPSSSCSALGAVGPRKRRHACRLALALSFVPPVLPCAPETASALLAVAGVAPCALSDMYKFTTFQARGHTPPLGGALSPTACAACALCGR